MKAHGVFQKLLAGAGSWEAARVNFPNTMHLWEQSVHAWKGWQNIWHTCAD